MCHDDPGFRQAERLMKRWTFHQRNAPLHSPQQLLGAARSRWAIDVVNPVPNLPWWFALRVVRSHETKVIERLRARGLPCWIPLRFTYRVRSSVPDGLVPEITTQWSWHLRESLRVEPALEGYVFIGSADPDILRRNWGGFIPSMGPDRAHILDWDGEFPIARASLAHLASFNREVHRMADWNVNDTVRVRSGLYRGRIGTIVGRQGVRYPVRIPVVREPHVVDVPLAYCRLTTWQSSDHWSLGDTVQILEGPHHDQVGVIEYMRGERCHVRVPGQYTVTTLLDADEITWARFDPGAAVLITEGPLGGRHGLLEADYGEQLLVDLGPAHQPVQVPTRYCVVATHLETSRRRELSPRETLSQLGAILFVPGEFGVAEQSRLRRASLQLGPSERTQDRLIELLDVGYQNLGPDDQQVVKDALARAIQP